MNRDLREAVEDLVEEISDELKREQTPIEGVFTLLGIGLLLTFIVGIPYAIIWNIADLLAWLF